VVNFPLLGRFCFLSVKRRELVWRQGPEVAVRAPVIAIIAPCFDGLAGLREVDECVFVEAFIAQPAVK
jgi:hypothetical protein